MKYKYTLYQNRRAIVEFDDKYLEKGEDLETAAYRIAYECDLWYVDFYSIDPWDEY